MAKPTRNKRTAAAVKPAQSRTEANDYIRHIGAAQRELQRIEADMNEQLARIRESFEELAAPLRDVINTRTEAVQAWCEVNRDALTRGGKVKTARLPAGDVSWRTNPPSVTVRGNDAVLTALHGAGMEAFIRPGNESVNKDAILATPPDHPVRQIDGITIVQREEFIVAPFETELSEEAAA